MKDQTSSTNPRKRGKSHHNHDDEGTVSIGGRTITNPRFADDIDSLAGEEEELAKLV